LEQLWKLSDVKIDPESGVMFYLRQLDNEDNGSDAIFRILDEIDIEANSFKVKKIICYREIQVIRA
jgi:hypothetical protein